MNYNEEMKKIIKTFDNKKTILLHSCCGPCSSSVIERIKPYFDITVLYYNPNIEPKEEYEKRKSEQIRLLKELNIKYMDCDYDNDIYREKIKGTEALLLITDLNTCDSEALNILKTENILTETQGESYCLSIRNALKGGIEVSIDVLKKYNYLTDYDEQCSGTVTLKINNANPEADGSNIECRW